MTLESFFTSGMAVDLVLAMVVAEGVVLALGAMRGGRLAALGGLGWSLASGGCLALALRVALAGGPWYGVAAGLGGSFVAHLMDLRQRWRAAGG